MSLQDEKQFNLIASYINISNQDSMDTNLTDSYDAAETPLTHLPALCRPLQLVQSQAMAVAGIVLDDELHQQMKDVTKSRRSASVGE